MDKAVEAMARALAKSEYSGGGEWRAYISDAQAALAAYHAHLAEQGLVIVPEEAFEIGSLANIIHDNYDGSPAEIAIAVHTAIIEAAKGRRGLGDGLPPSAPF